MVSDETFRLSVTHKPQPDDPYLSRDRPCQAPNAPSRSRGRGWGNIKLSSPAGRPPEISPGPTSGTVDQANLARKRVLTPFPSGTGGDLRVSIRPRPFGRGELRNVRHDSLADLVSIRPRPFGRGERCRAITARWRSTEFQSALALSGEGNVGVVMVAALVWLFQSALALSGEGNVVVCHQIVLPLVSIRPRPFGRGERENDPSRPAVDRFNPPSPFRARGTDRMRAAERRGGHVSIRPRPFGRGEHRRPDVTGRGNVSIRPRPFGRGER